MNGAILNKVIRTTQAFSDAWYFDWRWRTKLGCAAREAFVVECQKALAVARKTDMHRICEIKLGAIQAHRLQHLGLAVEVHVWQAGEMLDDSGAFVRVEIVVPGQSPNQLLNHRERYVNCGAFLHDPSRDRALARSLGVGGIVHIEAYQDVGIDSVHYSERCRAAFIALATSNSDRFLGLPL